MPTSYPRGTVLKVYFPYDDSPSLPGPQVHYCMFIEQYSFGGKDYAAVCYGTSRLDEKLIQSHQGLIWSVDSKFIKGEMPGHVTHFVADHVALIALNDTWVRPDFQARLDFMREDKRKNDVQRQRLFQQFEAFEKCLEQAALDTLAKCTEAGRIGLPPGKKLRK